MQLSHAVGYRGYAFLGATGSGKKLLCTGGSVSLTQQPIMGTGVWGAGYQNAASIAYAWNYLKLEGSCNFQLTSKGQWAELKKFMLTNRANITGTHLELKPDGTNGFSGNAWCSSLSFEASQGSAVTGSFNFQGDGGGGGFTAGLSPSTTAIITDTAGFAGEFLIAYYKTKVDGISQLTQWSVNGNSDIQLLKCCKSEATAPKSADYLVLGQLSADGSYTVFGVAGDFDPNNYHKIKSLTFRMHTYSVTIPKAIVNSASTSMVTGSSYVTAQFSFNGLGSGSSAIFSMS